MIISNLSYLEVVSEVSSIVGGQKDKAQIKQEQIIRKNKVYLESDNITIDIEQSVSVTSDDKVVISIYALEH